MKTNTFALVVVLIGAGRARVLAQDTGQAPKPGTVEIGVANVSDGSYKAGEYNGFENKGGNGLGNFDYRNLVPYNSANRLRWRVRGLDLGLETRSVFADAGIQGKFRFRFVYDALRRNRSDSFQTPLSGAGTNTLALPGFWTVPTVAGSTAGNNAANVVSARGLVPLIGTAPYLDTKTTSPTMGALLVPNSTQIAQVLAAAADASAFTNVNLYTKRSKVDVAFNYNFNDQWSADASVRPEHKSGMKPMGTVSRNTNGDISTTIPDLVDTDHDQVAANLNFKGNKSFAQVGFYASSFTNHVPSMSWQNWATPTLTVNTISSTPSNLFGQVQATGGMSFSPRTKLVMNGSYGRATQNDAFITSSTTPIVPVGSLDGLVVTTAFNSRFTARPLKKLNVTAAYKFNERDNRTPIHIYQYSDAEEPLAANPNFPAGPNNPLGAVVAQNANANRPYSRRLNQGSLDADYAVASSSWIKLGYEAERINRWCTNSWVSCADAAVTNEQTAKAEWRSMVDNAVTARLTYAYSRRRTPFYNENAFLAIVPYANVAPITATNGATAYSFMNANGLNGWGPRAGYAPTTGNMNVFFPNNNPLPNAIYANNNRISELPGMRRYFVADRNRDKVRGSLEWQATNVLALQGGLELNKDAYPNSTYGLQNSKGWAADVDGDYALPGNVSANVFYTYEDQRAVTAGNTYTANSNVATPAGGQPGALAVTGNAACDSYLTMQERNNNNKLDPCLNWSAAMLDRASTGGFGLRAGGAKVGLSGDVVVSRARWNNNVTGGNWANNPLDGPGAPPTTIAAFYIPASPLPAVTTNTLELRLTGTYSVARGQAVRLSYAYLRMSSSDWMYQGMQIGAGTIGPVLPTNEQPFNYRVNVVGLSYVVTF